VSSGTNGIQALLCVYSLALLVERELTRAMERAGEGIASLRSQCPPSR
jgi:hypothetical protein